MDERTVAVIGGGPAGMMAAIASAQAGAKTVLIERNEKLGKKLYLTGKGRCNLTNAIPKHELILRIPRNGRFMHSALSRLSNAALMKFFEERGVPLKVERGERVFPVSDKASDITKALTKQLEALNVEILLNTRVVEIKVEPKNEGNTFTLKLSSSELKCGALILATGGLSYPQTGSTGDGLRFAKNFGHTIVTPSPSLVPIETVEEWPTRLQGLSLKNVRLSAKIGKKTLFSEQGEMLFTHFGISGPLVLSLSSHIDEQQFSKVDLYIDLKPALDIETLDARLLRDFNEASNRQFTHAFDDLLPRAMAPIFAELTQIAQVTKINQITRKQRLDIAALLKALPLHIKKYRPIEEAVITRGGISTREIEPGTMRSRIIQNLYFAGELIDVDAYTGGFNLQIAFSTGYTAGKAAAGEAASGGQGGSTSLDPPFDGDNNYEL